MLSGSGVPVSRTCCTCSEPTPSSSPVCPIIPVPPQNGWAGVVNIASSSTYSQLPANSCLAAMWRHHRVLAATGAGNNHLIADFRRLRLPDRQCRQPEPRQRLHQPEPGHLVVGDHVAGNRAPVREMEPDGLGLGNEVADGEHHAVANQNAVAGALGAERLGGEGVGRNDRPQPHHRGQGGLEVIAVILRLGLVGSRHLPIARR